MILSHDLIQEDDVCKGKVTGLSVQFSLPLTVHVGFRDGDQVPDMQSQGRLVVRVRHCVCSVVVRH